MTTNATMDSPGFYWGFLPVRVSGSVFASLAVYVAMEAVVGWLYHFPGENVNPKSLRYAIVVLSVFGYINWFLCGPETALVVMIVLFFVAKMWRRYPRRRKLVVLDLSGVLLDKVHHPGKSEDEGTDGVIRVRSKLLYRRPGLDEFLRFLFANFDVAVWSSQQPQNVVPAVMHAFGNYARHLTFVFSQADCEEIIHPGDGQEHPETLFAKPLERVWEMSSSYDEHNTILVDDCPFKSSLNPERTRLCPPRWTHDHDDDTGLIEIACTLTEFCLE